MACASLFTPSKIRYLVYKTVTFHATIPVENSEDVYGFTSKGRQTFEKNRKAVMKDF